MLAQAADVGDSGEAADAGIEEPKTVVPDTTPEPSDDALAVALGTQSDDEASKLLDEAAGGGWACDIV